MGRSATRELRVFATVLGLLAACGDGDIGGEDPPEGEIVSLSLTAPSDTLVVVNGVAAEQPYTLTANLESGRTADVTDKGSFSLENEAVGSFNANVMRATGGAGGATTVTGSYAGKSATAMLTVRVENTRIDPPAPADAPDKFNAATEDAGRAPSLVYPSDGTLAPPNLGSFEAHWRDSNSSDLFEVSFVGEFATFKIYVSGSAATGLYSGLTVKESRIMGASQRGSSMTITVRGMSTASPEKAGSSEAIRVDLADSNLEGGIYYWASTGALPGGIYRHDMGRPGEPAEAFYTTGESPDGRCVACHVISRDGTKMAITYDGGDGKSSIIDIATRTEMLPSTGPFAWNFATFDPSGTKLVTTSSGTLTLRDASTGAGINIVPTGGYASHPEMSPDGDTLVYTRVMQPAADWSFAGGIITTISFDPASNAWGAPTPLVTPGPGQNAYYPSFSPDGDWILFNQSTAGSYDAASAELYVVKADGSSPPVLLSSPNRSAGLTNSWARWAPFVQERGAESFYWLTFSSKREFGVRDAGHPQIWMAPFFPDRAASGSDPSAPALWLPFQELTTNNHIAQWTERVIKID